MAGADLLGMSLKDLKHEIGIGAIVPVPTRLGQRIGKEEMIAAALRVWPQAVIEEALGEEAAVVLPEVIRLVELRASIPRYQRDMLRVLAEARDDGRRGPHARAGTSPRPTRATWPAPCPTAGSPCDGRRAARRRRGRRARR